MNEETVKTLHLPFHLSSNDVSMAVDWLKESVLDHCSTEIALSGTVYGNVQLRVMRILCCDVFLGKNFHRLHRRVAFTYDGTQSRAWGTLLASAWNLCGHSSNSRVPLFVPRHPVALPSRR